MTSNLQVWHEKVIKSRFITSCLRTDLQRIDKLYGRLARCSFELYKLRKEVDVEYIPVCFLSLVINHKKIAKKTENDCISRPLQTRKESHELWQDFII